MSYVIPFDANPTAAVRGETGRFPIRRVFCVGRNYADHAREMGHDPDREPPFFFMKPSWSVVAAAGDIPYPTCTSDLHHEIELVCAIGTGGAGIAEAKALEHVYGYAVGVDLTRRDLQGEAKKLGRPWDTGKGFDASGPMGEVVPAAAIGHPSSGRIWLAIDGETRQDGDVKQLIWTVPETIAYLSTLFRLEPGDLVFTGTPAGVGPVQRGDRLTGGVDGLGEIGFRIV
jgi:fumarylpyruvate hydrolase